jgi:hypothetical protein
MGAYTKVAIERRAGIRRLVKEANRLAARCSAPREGERPTEGQVRFLESLSTPETLLRTREL